MTHGVAGQPGLLTVGHGTLDREQLAELLTKAGVTTLVDVRRFPGSRNNPDVAREALEQWLPRAGIAYRWEPRLGGRRRLGPDERAAPQDPWWQVEAFRAYAAWTRSAEFGQALDGVLRLATGERVAVMCSESVWWRCHRRVIADVVVLGHGVPVHHLMHGGALRPHEPSSGARLVGPDRLVWDKVDDDAIGSATDDGARGVRRDRPEQPTVTQPDEAAPRTRGAP